MPREYQNPSGQIVLDYAKAVQESVFEQLRVVRDGQLRIVFSPDLKVTCTKINTICYVFNYFIYIQFTLTSHVILMLSRYAHGSSVHAAMKSSYLEDC